MKLIVRTFDPSGKPKLRVWDPRVGEIAQREFNVPANPPNRPSPPRQESHYCGTESLILDLEVRSPGPESQIRRLNPYQSAESEAEIDNPDYAFLIRVPVSFGECVSWGDSPSAGGFHPNET